MDVSHSEGLHVEIGLLHVIIVLAAILFNPVGAASLVVFPRTRTVQSSACALTPVTCNTIFTGSNPAPDESAPSPPPTTPPPPVSQAQTSIRNFALAAKTVSAAIAQGYSEQVGLLPHDSIRTLNSTIIHQNWSIENNASLRELLKPVVTYYRLFLLYKCKIEANEHTYLYEESLLADNCSPACISSLFNSLRDIIHSICTRTGSDEQLAPLVEYETAVTSSAGHLLGDDVSIARDARVTLVDEISDFFSRVANADNWQ